MPHFRNGYDERLDLTEDEYLAQLMDTADYLDDDVAWVTASLKRQGFTDADIEPEPYSDTPPDALEVPGLEGEPWEDTYLPGIPDYDRFNRPSWET